MRLSLGGEAARRDVDEPRAPSVRDCRKCTNGSKMWDPVSNKDCSVEMRCTEKLPSGSESGAPCIPCSKSGSESSRNPEKVMVKFEGAGACPSNLRRLEEGWNFMLCL